MLVAIAVGAGLGVYGARVVRMTQMPQRWWPCSNGVGGGPPRWWRSSELHAYLPVGDVLGWDTWAITAFTVVVGAVSFAGRWSRSPSCRS